MRQRNSVTLLVSIVSFAIALLMFFPILWTFLTGLKSETDALSIPPVFWFVPSLDKYIYAFQQGEFLSFFYNTVIIVGCAIAGSFALGLPAAYVLAFFPGRRADSMLFFALSTRFMPGVAVVVPISIVCSRLHLIETRFGLILMHITLGIPMVMWLMRRYFSEIPMEIIESVMLEGASHARIFCRIVLPLSIPGLVTTGFLIMIMAWNEFFFAVNLAGRSAATLSVFMAFFLTTEGQTWAQMSAAATLAILPIFATGLIASRGLVRGLTNGASH